MKFELTREESMSTVKRRERCVSYAKLGLRKDGTLTAIYFRHIFDNGAYGDKFDPFESVVNLYQTPNGRFEKYGVSTNLVTGGCMQGVGDLTMTFCMEGLIDKAAEKLRMDPVKLRLKNHFQAGDIIRLQSSESRLSSCGLRECLQKGAKAMMWKEKWKGWGKPVAVNGSKRRGIGVAIANHISGRSKLGSPSVIMRVNSDGSVHLLTGIGRLGQGAETTQAQIAAEELGVPFDSIVGTHGDTDVCPWSPPSRSSINAHVTGRATRAAAADAKRQLLEIAATYLKAKVKDLDIEDGVIHTKTNRSKSVTIRQLLGSPLRGDSAPPQIVGRGWSIPISPTARMTMAHFVEVEVDVETGKVEVLKYVAAHDSGKILNPAICEGLVTGGVTLGIGFTLFENLIFDAKTGRVLNPNYSDYKICTALDSPNPQAIFVEPIDPIGPFGAKGIGEATICPVPAAMANAIYNAIGKRLDVPITPDKILG